MRQVLACVLSVAACVGAVGDSDTGAKMPMGGEPGGGGEGGGNEPGGGGDDEPGDPNNPGVAPGACGNDKLGAKQIYCTKTGGDEWFINMDNPEEARFNPKTDLTRNMDGSWKVTDTQVRMNVFTKEGYNQGLMTGFDPDDLQTKGFMQSAADWRNVEITGYVKVNDPGAGDDNFAWYARGGYHGDNAKDPKCEGTCYKGDLHYSGKTRIAKEQWHNSGYAYTDDKPAQDGTLVGRWVGFKTVMFNNAANTEVTVELYADWQANNTWVKIDELHDTTGFGKEGTVCGGKEDAPVTWGGPVATFRWDAATDVDFKNLSVREIAPPP